MATEEQKPDTEALNPREKLLQENIDKLTHMLEQQEDMISKIKEVVNIHGEVLKQMQPGATQQPLTQAATGQATQAQGQGDLTPLMQLLGTVMQPRQDPLTSMLLQSYSNYLTSMVTLGNKIVEQVIKGNVKGGLAEGAGELRLIG